MVLSTSSVLRVGVGVAAILQKRPRKDRFCSLILEGSSARWYAGFYIPNYVLAQLLGAWQP